MSLDVGKIWEKMNEHPEFAAMPDGFKQALKPTVDALPEILGELADKPAGIATIAQAQIAYLKYVLENGYIKTTVEALPDEMLPMDKKTMVRMTENVVTESLETLKAIMEPGTIAQMLGAMEMMEVEALLSPQYGLNVEAQALYLTGRLTIGKLLEVQPSMILTGGE